MGADRGEPRRRLSASLVLAGVFVALGSSVPAFAADRESGGTVRIAGLVLSRLELDADEAFDWTVRGFFQTGDVCEVLVNGSSTGPSSPCAGKTGSHTFTSVGQHALVTVVRDTLGQVVMSRLLVVDVGAEDVLPVKFLSAQPIEPVTFASAQPVTVPTPVPVRWKGCDPVTSECPQGGGFGSWTDDDGENLAHIAGQTQRQSRNTVAIGALTLFALAGIVTLSLQRVR